MRLASLLAIALAAPSAAAAQTSRQSCEDIVPQANGRHAPQPLVPEDLVRLRDIGPVDPAGHAAPFFTLSPDGGRVAFQLRRGDPARNRYCLAMAVMELRPNARPTIVDQGGDFIMLTVDIRGRADHPLGTARVITPLWSPDGRWIAFLKRIDGTTQVWRAMTDGSGSVPLTRSPTDVVDFRIGADGGTIVFATRPALQRTLDAIEREGLSGFHYDDRFSPPSGDRPFPASPVQREVQVLDLTSGAVRAATAAEASVVNVNRELIATAGAPTGSERSLWITATNLSGGAQPGAFHARTPEGATLICEARECEGASEPWFLPGNRRVRFFRREGFGQSLTAIYEWDLAARTVRRLYMTEDLLADCTPDAETLVCLREASLEPRRLELLDPRTGARLLLFDPNPEFRTLALGRVERLHWRNSFGLETYGDLVLPVDYRRGRRYPLVVVQYVTRGFLRGGTGDDYPIQAFANRGYAVLSIQSPIPIGAARGAQNFLDAIRINNENHAERRSVLSSVEVGVGMAIDRGIADPERIGITGLSAGASTATFAVLHSRLFSAVAISSCCIDTTVSMRNGPGAGRNLRESGYPGMLERDSPFWRDLSLSANARRITTPMLLQLSDDEYQTALETFATLRQAGAPIDMFVFPDEHHAKWQPAHRLATYRRSLDWFDYWLRNVRSSDADRQTELRHWDQLRTRSVDEPTP
jgi:dipeptidyl aminopeptidase/acylaminoacyl peptidase